MAASVAALAAPCLETALPAPTELHLFTSFTALPAWEREILDRFLAEFAPEPGASNELTDLCTRWALVRYRIDKCHRLEFACQAELTRQLCTTEEIPFPEDPETRAYLEGRAFISDVDGARVLVRLYNQEARLKRELDGIVREYQSLTSGRLQQATQAEPSLEELMRECEEATAQRKALEAEMGLFCHSENTAPETPRSSACPCGSGLKYKRCCGKNAPPHLNHTGCNSKMAK